MSLLDLFKDLHASVLRDIAAGRSGLGQIRVDGQVVSLITEGGFVHVYGVLPSNTPVSELKNAIMDDLVDDTKDHGAAASGKGLITKKDFLDRADYYEHRFLFSNPKDQAFAKEMREFAATWPG